MKALLFALLLLPTALLAVTPVEPPMLRADVASGKLPPVQKRLPAQPLVVKVENPGKHGGTLNSLVGRSRDTRLLVVYGYARLVGYDTKLELVPDMLEAIEVKEGRIFTLKLRKGHRWSDGHPFTAEDFRYYWEDVANNKELSPSGPPKDMMVDGEAPKFEVLSETSVRYSW
jgi:peptide/nickel transport system substrate-binding protein